MSTLRSISSGLSGGPDRCAPGPPLPSDPPSGRRRRPDALGSELRLPRPHIGQDRYWIVWSRSEVAHAAAELDFGQ
eukprot:11188515-Lingulodinium_polyedra.AAC.1